MLTSERLKLLAVLSLLLGTLLLFCFSERYSVAGNELLHDSQELDAAGSWTKSDVGVSVESKNPGVARLTSRENSALIHLSQDIAVPQRFRLLQLSVYMKTQGVLRGKQSWETARVLLVSRDSRGNEMYYLPHTLVGRYGNNDWRQYKKVFRVDNDAEEIQVSAQLMHAPGVMWIRDISLVPVSEREEFSRYRGILIALWLATIAWIITYIFSNAGMSIGWVFALIISAGIVSGALLPESVKKHIDRSLLQEGYSDGQSVEQASSSGGSSPQAGSILRKFRIYKFGHFVLFGLLAAVVVLGRFFEKPIVCLLGYLALFAFCTEVWQFFVDGREPGITDFLIDTSGIIAGAAVASLYRRAALSRQYGV